MCCRYYMELSPELRPIVEEMNRSPLVRRFQETSAVLTSGEIRPSNVAPVIASNRRGERAVFPMKWGFNVSGRPLLINARVETAAEKPIRFIHDRMPMMLPEERIGEWIRPDCDAAEIAAFAQKNMVFEKAG